MSNAPSHNPFAVKSRTTLQDAAFQRADVAQRRRSSGVKVDMTQSMQALPTSTSMSPSDNNHNNMTSSWHGQQQQGYAQIPNNSFFGNVQPYNPTSPTTPGSSGLPPSATPSPSPGAPPPAAAAAPPGSREMDRTMDHPTSTKEAIREAKEQWNKAGGKEGGQVLEVRGGFLFSQATPPSTKCFLLPYSNAQHPKQ